MITNQIIAQIDQEIERLTKAKELLMGTAVNTGRGRRVASGVSASPKRKRRKMSAEGRARIAAAQKARWAKVKAKKG